MKRVAAYSTFLGFSVLCVPGSADAQGLVSSCQGSNCSACDIITLVNTAVQWGVTILSMFFSILAVYYGFRLVISGGSSGAKEAAKSGFANAFVGLVIVLGAWLIVDTLMRGVVRGSDGNIQGYGPWTKIQCLDQVQSGFGTIAVDESEFEVRPPSADDFVIPSNLPNGATGQSGMNIRNAVSYLIRNAESEPIGFCLRYVSEAINAGLPSFATRGVNHAKDAGPKLTRSGFTVVYTGRYVPRVTDRGFQAQAGDVAIFQPGCARSISGHAAMYTGSMWISDFRQNQMGPNGRGSCQVTIYRP